MRTDAELRVGLQGPDASALAAVVVATRPELARDPQRVSVDLQPQPVQQLAQRLALPQEPPQERQAELVGEGVDRLPLGGDRLLVLYNRRYGQQGIVAALATFTDTVWTVHHEQLFYDARAFRDGPSSGATGVDELASFQFGFPTAIRLNDGTFLATHWCVERGVTGIRLTKFRADW